LGYLLEILAIPFFGYYNSKVEGSFEELRVQGRFVGSRISILVLGVDLPFVPP